MLRVMTMQAEPDGPAAIETMLAALRRAADRDLVPLVRRIDEEGLYPEAALRAFGAAGAYAAHLPAGGPRGAAHLGGAIQAVAEAGEHCLTAAYCMTCQAALAFVIACSHNAELRDGLGPRVAAGTVLGGVGLANPIKTYLGLERIALDGARAAGGYRVSGTLPFVSNLGPDHVFAAVFARPEGRTAMAVMRCGAEGLRLGEPGRFLALGGARTRAVEFRDVFVPDEDLLADPLEGFYKRVRAAVLLLQIGMAIGLVRGSLRLMCDVARVLAPANRALDVQPREVSDRLDALEDEVDRLAATPFETDPAYWRRVLEARLAASELALCAAQNALLHCGTAGLLVGAGAQRRLREACFLAVATPAIKHLKRMLAELQH
ncbi:putative acyl-CoA dehydrogenase [Methylobacterium sp. 4-46]|uniref:acyl-CoA dehydrogenase family protein n=1 Tax=unclassified Methylobacterium TaxID=2615210 RepID=UPI000152C6FA|nr:MULTISPECIES: acyl-CoA dehydrogenase family protein [Methylobacterium]ACA19150.1 putative acyl-CoA dehydrogenase [Methylobacterium sp. 4-46]WFT78359.1 acyl-CoA/acyl-ACP dehydrogenase [Methylobacterium nodulans]